MVLSCPELPWSSPALNYVQGCLELRWASGHSQGLGWDFRIPTLALDFVTVAAAPAGHTGALLAKQLL